RRFREYGRHAGCASLVQCLRLRFLVTVYLIADYLFTSYFRFSNSPRSFTHNLIQLLTRHRAQLRMLLQPIQELGLDFIGPLIVNFTGAVFAGPNHFETKLVFPDDKFRDTDNILGHMGGYKEHTFHRGYDEITGQDNSPSDTNWGIKSHQDHLFGKRRMEVANKRVESLYIADLLKVTGGAIEHDTVPGFAVN